MSYFLLLTLCYSEIIREDLADSVKLTTVTNKVYRFYVINMCTF